MADIMTPVSEIERIFHLQKEHQFKVARSTATERIAKLKKIIKAVGTDYKDDIREACYKDLRKSHFEVDMTEIYPVLTEARHAVRHLRSWMKGEKVPTPMALTGSTSWVHHEPKGVCLIISPWNFPFNLTFVPLISAIAAGNTIVLKPSEMSPAVSHLMSRIIADLFDEREVTLVQGGVDTSTELLKQPFNHIFFTGSPGIGKIVMRAAAEHLTSVTLELGGKSPTIIDDTADIKTAARRTVFFKFLNSGQICIAPDYICVHENKKEEFIKACRHYITEFYGEDPRNSPGYARIINERHFDRVVSYMEETIEMGGNIVFGGKSDRDQKYISPTLVEGAPQDSPLMQEEIFGPVLPVMTFRDLSEPVEYLKSREKPLALYIYSQSQKNIDYLIDNTRAGGTAVNHTGIHISNHDLPFGGDNNSGMGKCHGIYGFKAFSNERSIYRQNLPSVLDILSPPYNGWKQKLVDLTLKWF
jgi:aldehyde dehydrogenase (NAD+)